MDAATFNARNNEKLALCRSCCLPNLCYNACTRNMYIAAYVY